MKKYVGAVVRKLSQLVIVADIDLLGNIKYLSKYVQEIYGSLKNKTIYTSFCATKRSEVSSGKSNHGVTAALRPCMH